MISSNEDIGNYLNNSNNTFNMVVKVVHIESIGAIAKVVDRLCNWQKSLFITNKFPRVFVND